MIRPNGLGFVIAFGIIVTLWTSGCDVPARTDTLRLDGSRLMLRVTKAWADHLGKMKSPLGVEVGEGGSTVAIQKLLNGEIDVATASRRIRSDEIVDARSRGVKIEEACIGFLIYSVVVHPSNPVTDLTTQQVSEIFSGQLKEWAQVGGPKQPITRVYRRVKPGEYDHFFERVVKGEPAEAGTVVLDKPDQIGQKVASEPLAVGYLLVGDLPADKSAVKLVPIRRTPKDPAAAPTVEKALEGKYPLLRPLYLYINKASPRPVGYFRDFVLGEGRKISAEDSMAPLPEVRRGKLDPDRLYEMLSW